MRVLSSHRGAFGPIEARHLLCRAGFGSSPRDLEIACEQGLEKTVASLLAGSFQPRMAEKSLARMERIGVGSFEQLRARFILRATLGGDVLRSRMTLVLHDHFATAFRKVRSLDFMLRHLETLRGQALGDFRRLLLDLCADPAMLIWLDGDASTRQRPNENFAREFFELFTLGRGHYSEADVKAAARVFTGRRVNDSGSRFVAEDHDDQPKAILGHELRDEAELIDLVLGDEAGARYLAIMLASPMLGPATAKRHGQELGEAWTKTEHRIDHFLAELLTSDLMFTAADGKEPSARARGIRSPLEYVIGSLRGLEARGRASDMAASAAAMGQSFGDPPSVAGWPSGRSWISTATIAARQRFALDLSLGRQGPLALRSTIGEDVSQTALSFALLGIKVENADQADEESNLFLRAGRLLARPEAQLI